MRLETTAGMLRTSLEIAGRVIVRRASIPLLESVVFDGATLHAINLDIDISIPILAKKAEGQAAIAYWPLMHLVRGLPRDEEIVLTVDGEGASLSFSSGRHSLAVYPIADFPKVDVGETVPVKIDGDRLRAAIAFVSTSMSAEETRYYLNGVCLDDKHAVATNGHIMAAHPLGFDGSAFGRIILPKQLVHLLNSLPAASAISVAPTRISIEAGGISIRAKTIDGKFPDWNRVVPGHNAYAEWIELAPAKLIAALKRLSAVARVVTLSFDRRSFAIVGKGDQATAREFIAGATMSGGDEPVTRSFQARYLRQQLDALGKCDRVRLQFTMDGSPLLIADANNQGEDTPFLLLMPMRVGEEDIALSALAEMSSGRAAA